MTLVKKGDLIFNYSNGIRAISRATKDNYEGSDNRGEAIYRVDVEMFELNEPIDSEQVRDKARFIPKNTWSALTVHLIAMIR